MPCFRGSAFAGGRDPGTRNRAIVVTFGGGVRWEDTFAPEGWPNIPHLVSDLVPQGLFFPEARYEGLTGHFNATGALVTGCLQNVDAYGSEAPDDADRLRVLPQGAGPAPEEAWVVASNKSFGLLGGSKLRGLGRSLRGQRDPAQALPRRGDQVGGGAPTPGPGVEDREALAERMVSALDEGYEGFGWRVHEAGRALGQEVRATLAQSLLDYFNDPLVPTSGDELTFFMTKEIMSRLAPSAPARATSGTSTSPTSAPIRSTSRRSGAPTAWCTASGSTRSRCPRYRDRTTLIVVPEMGRDGDRERQRLRRTTAAATSRAAGCGCSRWARACRGGSCRSGRSARSTWRPRWPASWASRCRRARAGPSSELAF